MPERRGCLGRTYRAKGKRRRGGTVAETCRNIYLWGKASQGPFAVVGQLDFLSCLSCLFGVLESLLVPVDWLESSIDFYTLRSAVEML
jgi:hypothetical protein